MSYYLQGQEPVPATERYLNNTQSIRDIDEHLKIDSAQFVGGPAGVPTNVVSFDNSHGLREAIDKAATAMTERIRWLKEHGIS